jgi:heavy metal sensor kinase
MTDVSIRVRLTAWYAAAMLTGLSLFGVAMWFALESRLLAGVDTRLEQRIRGLMAAGVQGETPGRAHLQHELAEFATEIQDGTLIQLRDSSGRYIMPSPAQTTFSERAPARGTVRHEGRAFRVAARQVALAGQQFEVLVAGSLDDVDVVMRDFRNLLLLLIPAVLAIACLGGYWLSVRALRPVDAITTVAKSIGVQNLSQRLAVPRTGDELQRMAETWNEVLERLESSVKRIRQFTADASHELRTPLALIRTTAELALRRDRSTGEYRESLRAIETEAAHMTDLTESLLAMARADAGGFRVQLETIDLSPVIAGVIDQHQAIASEKGIRLQAEEPGRPAPARADGDAIRRLLLILIDNALKHTPTGGAITVAARQSGGGVSISVADTGDGIAPEDLPHIFERFYRSDPVRAGGSGFGLGLSIAQAIAQAHGARMTVDSVPGEGARFTVALKN